MSVPDPALQARFQPGDRVVSKLGTRSVVLGNRRGRDGYTLVQVRLYDGRVCNYPPFLLKKEASQ